MAIAFECGCGRSIHARDSLAGLCTRCPGCGEVVRIPVPGAADPAAGVVASTAKVPASRDPGPRPGGVTATASAPLGATLREYLYLILALALIPLGLTLLSGAEGRGSIAERLRRALKEASPEVVARLEKMTKSEGGATVDDLIDALPGGRLDRKAHLPRRSWRHWLYGGLAAASFWALILGLFPAESRRAGRLFKIGLFTGTIGIVLLIGVQTLAGATRGYWIEGSNVLVLLVFYLAKFIGSSYDSANDPDSSLLVSFLGFTCGVGFCEELCKALPLIVHYRREATLGWRGACLWGLASGVGFGVSEGILYSGSYYNGISPGTTYILRFVSCVALHAAWSASVGITLWRRQETIQPGTYWADYVPAFLRILAVPVLLHGLYDTLLKKDLDLFAFAAGVLTFAWFIWQVESARRAAGEHPAGDFRDG